MTFLLDTNIVSFAIKQDSRIQQYAHLLTGSPGAISFMGGAELDQQAAIYQSGGVSGLESTQTYLQPSTPFCLGHWRCVSCGGKFGQRLRHEISADDAWVRPRRCSTIPLLLTTPKILRPCLTCTSILLLESAIKKEPCLETSTALLLTS